MKFYRNKAIGLFIHLDIIKNNKLTAIYMDNFGGDFFKDGLRHNSKNAAYIRYDGYKQFYLNNKCYGDEDDFTKQSWRRFVKMQVFL